jgi:hypothetical protein
MQSSSWKAGAALLAACWAFAGADALAQLPTPPYTTVHTVASADVAVPVEETLPIANAGTYQVTLTDLGAQLPTPAPLASVKLAVTGGGSIVGTPLSAPGSTSFDAAAGSYIIHIVGTPGNVPGSGPFGITVTDAGHNVVASYSGTLALPQAGIPSNQGVLTGSFTVQTSGSYQVTLADLQFPAALNTLTLALVQQGMGLVMSLPAAGTNAVALQSGVTYDVFAVGQSTSSPSAGLYGASITAAGGGTPVFARSVPVGVVTLVASPALAAGNYTLTLSDPKVPAALTSVGAAVALYGQSAAQLNAPGSTGLVATANTYQVYGFGVAGASGTGSYALALQPTGGAAVLSVARAVSAPGSAVKAFSFDAQVPSAGGYTVNLADFALPSAFTALSAVAIQNGASLGSQTGPGAVSIVAATGPLSVLAFAQPAASGSLFGLDLEPSGTTDPVFATTQGVGELFAGQQIAIDAAGTYKVTVTDVGFPSPFTNLGVVVTRGANQFGSIFVGGDFTFVATPGNYFVNFIAQPGGSDHAGTYALNVVSAPPAPIVTLTTDRASVTSGQTVNLIWTSQNASGCNASGGWSGTQPVNGNATSTALTANTTFTLTCTGTGGSSAKSVDVAVTAAPADGGGGGTVDPDLLLMLLLALAWRSASRRPSRVSHAGYLQF